MLQALARGLIASATLLAAGMTTVDAGTVFATNGRVLKGDIVVEGNRLGIVTREGSTPQRVDLTRSWVVDFTDNYPFMESHQESSFIAEGVLLANGTFLRGKIEKYDGKTIEITSSNRKFTLKADAVARINLRDLLSEGVNEVPLGGRGIITETGDFFEGRVSLQGDTYFVNSLVFGPNRIPERFVMAVVIGDSAQRSSRFIVTTKSGSTFTANDIDFRGDDVEIKADSLGDITVPKEDLARILLGRSTARSLLDYRPIYKRIIPTGYEDIIGDASYAFNLDKVNASLSLSPGYAAAFLVDEPYRGILAKLGFKTEIEANEPIKLRIRLDGAPAYESDWIRPGSEPVFIAVQQSFRSFVLIEAISPPNSKSSIPPVIVDPVLIRQ